MTTEQKKRIHLLRQRGLGYGEIAEVLGMQKNTVKTYCWRNGLLADDAPPVVPAEKEPTAACKQCGRKLRPSRTKPRKFCCESCRHIWWNANNAGVKRKGRRTVICAHCGAFFECYAYTGKKYCSRRCYFVHRFPDGGEAAAS